jgi:hypothetical protein
VGAHQLACPLFYVRHERLHRLGIWESGQPYEAIAVAELGPRSVERPVERLSCRRRAQQAVLDVALAAVFEPEEGMQRGLRPLQRPAIGS